MGSRRWPAVACKSFRCSWSGCSLGLRRSTHPLFNQYYFTLLQDVLSVLTDTFHKPGFNLQQHIILQLVAAVECSLLSEVAPKQRAMEFLCDLIGKSFPPLHRSQVEIFVLHSFNRAGL